MYIGNTPFQGLVGGGNILDASIEGVDLSTSAIAARLGYTPVDPGAAAFTATLTAKDIQQDNATYIKGKLAAGTATRLFGINGSDTIYIGSIDANHTGGTLFVKNGATQMVLDANGRLGIATGNPAYTLDVNGVARAQSRFIVGTATDSADRLFYVSGTATTSGTNQFAAVVNPTMPNTATGSVYGFYTNLNVATGATITNAYGLYVDGMSAPSSTITNKYGLYVADTNASYFAGALLVGSSTSGYSLAGRGLVEVNGSTSALYGLRVGNVNKGYLYHEGTNLYLSNDVSGAVIFNTAATERMRISSAGDTTVQGNFFLADDVKALVFGSGTTSYIIGSSTNNNIRFWTNSTERARFDSNGNFAIGVSPSSQFSAGKSIEVGTAGNALWSNGANDIRMSANVKYNLHAATGYASTYVQYAGTHQWFTSPSQAANTAVAWNTGMILNASGYLGVNQANPRTELDVTGRARFNSYLAIGRGPNNNDGLFWNITPNTAGTAYTPGYIGSASAGSAYLGMPSGGNGGLMLKVKRHGTTATDYTESSMTLSTYWDDSGNVGIGTNSPQSQLHVVTPSPNNSISFCVGASADGAIAYTNSELRECAFNVTSGSNFRISNITTSASSWRAIFRGTWSNNYEGGGLVSPAPYIEVNAANPSIVVGSRTLTVSRDASGYLIVNNGDAYRVAFTGSIEIFDNTQSSQATTSIATLNTIQAPSLRLAGSGAAVNFGAANSGDLYMDCEPGTRTVRLRNWNSGSPNIDVTVMKAGIFQPTSGISFPATQNASTDVNTLDDYEEGTWTPVLTFGSAGTANYSVQNGTYTKIGNLVTVSAIIVLSSRSTASGSVGINLPFACRSGTYYWTMSYTSNNITWASNSYGISGQIGSGSAALNFYNQLNGGSKSSLGASQIGDTGELIFTISYQTA